MEQYEENGKENFLKKTLQINNNSFNKKCKNKYKNNDSKQDKYLPSSKHTINYMEKKNSCRTTRSVGQIKRRNTENYSDPFLKKMNTFPTKYQKNIGLTKSYQFYKKYDQHQELKHRKKQQSFKNTYEELIPVIIKNENNYKKNRYAVYLKAYERSELCQLRKSHENEIDVDDSNVYIDLEDDKERQRIHMLRLLRSFHIKYESYTNLNSLCDYSIYYKDKSIKDELLKKQDCSNFIYYLANIGISNQDILKIANISENMYFLKDCNLYLLPWINKKLNEINNFNLRTFISFSVAFSVATLNSSIPLFIQYKTIGVIIPLFISYTVLIAPFLIQEVSSGCLIMDGYFSFFKSLSYYNLPLATIIFISTFFSTIKYIDTICMQLYYLWFFLRENNPWNFKNVNTKMCSKFNGSQNICDYMKNVCYYDKVTETCKINKLKLAIKLYDKLLNNYEVKQNTQNTILLVIFAFSSIFLFSYFSKFPICRNTLKLCLFLLISLLIFYIFIIHDYKFLLLLFTNVNLHEFWNILLDNELWISCITHCIANLSIYNGIYLQSSKGLRLGTNIFGIVYYIIISCFIMDILIFVVYANIISTFIKDIDKNYYFLDTLIHKNVHFILIPLANDYLDKYTKYLGMGVPIFFLVFIMLATVKRIEILCSPVKDIYENDYQKKLIYVWGLVIIIYFSYRVIGNTFRVIFTSHLLIIMILLSLMFINFNLFWLQGFTDYRESYEKYALVINNTLTFISEFSLIYIQINYELSNWISFFFLRQAINILLVPPISMLISESIFNRENKDSLPNILRKGYLLTIDTVIKTAQMQFQLLSDSFISKFFKHILILYLKYFGMDLVIMCFLHSINKFFLDNAILLKKKYSISEVNTSGMLIFFCFFIYFVYLHIPILEWIRKKHFLRVNHFSFLDLPNLYESKRRKYKISPLQEFLFK